MSYVLEALKKAQAQRDQGGVPGIHSVQLPLDGAQGKARSNLKPVLWAITVLLVVIVALLAWRMDVLAPATPEPKPVVPAVVQAPPVQALPAAVSPISEMASAPVVESVPESLAKGEVEVSAQVPVASNAEPAVLKKKAPAQRKEATEKPAAAPTTNAPRVHSVSELPEAIRRDLPTLVISGGSYSGNPAQRLIIVNNQVFTEGSQLTPSVVVRRIEQGTVVLSFRGYSYRVGY